MSKNPKDILIIALDTSTKESALNIIDSIGDAADFYKIGLELFTACGPEIVQEVKKKNKRIFLDCKFHDIPNTVCGAVRRAVNLGVDIMNVHTLGGKGMMYEAKKALLNEVQLQNRANLPLLIGVTILTSTSEEELNNEIGIPGEIDKHILKRAKLAKESKLDGVVASPKEASLIREEIGADFLIVTPGIRPSWAQANDQKRIATPKQAIENGSTHIVVGRPITGADNLKDATIKVLEEIEEGLLLFQ